MFEVEPDCGGPSRNQRGGGGFARAFGQTLRDGTGAKCPHGCKGSAALLWGLVSHLVERHGYTLEAAKKKAGYHGS